MSGESNAELIVRMAKIAYRDESELMQARFPQWIADLLGEREAALKAVHTTWLRFDAFCNQSTCLYCHMYADEPEDFPHTPECVVRILI